MMNFELKHLIWFMAKLTSCSMGHEAVVHHGYEFALAMYRANAERALPLGDELSATAQHNIMVRAAELLAEAVGRGIEREAGETCS